MCKIFVEKYKNVSDNELICKIRQNDQDAFETLFYRYLPLIKRIIAKNAFAGNDYDDMLQDATISFYYAVQMYDSDSASFVTFLSLCVDRSLKSTIRKASAKKRIPEELIVPIDDNPEDRLKTLSAEEEYFGQADYDLASDKYKSRLSDMEFKVLSSFLDTESYDVTAERLGISRKSVDNAMVRIRKKLNSLK